MSIEAISLHVQAVQEYLKLSIEGKMVYGNSQNAKLRIAECLKEANGYIFDMSRLTKIDSTGFGVLVNVAKLLGKKQRKMVIIVIDPLVNELFQIAKLHFLFPIVATEAEAIDSLRLDNKEKWDVNDY